MKTRFQTGLSLIILMILLIVGCDYPKPKSISKVNKNSFSIKWIKTRLNIDIKQVFNGEGYKKIHIYLLFKNDSKDTLYIPLIRPKSEYESFFTLLTKNINTESIDTNKVFFYSNHDTYRVLPQITDTLVFDCSLKTFDFNESIIKSVLWAGRGELLFIPKKDSFKSRDFQNSFVSINRDSNYLLEINYLFPK